MDASSGSISFSSIISPVTNLRGKHSRTEESVQFSFKRRNGTLSLQWEPFEGYIIPTGTLYLEVRQGISGKPPFLTRYPVWMDYGGRKVLGILNIDPDENRSDISFELPYPTLGANERIEIYGSCIEWHVPPGC
jgi:hypothetical protein